MIPNHLRSWGWLIDKSSFLYWHLLVVFFVNMPFTLYMLRFSSPQQLTTYVGCGKLPLSVKFGILASRVFELENAPIPT